MAKIELKFLDNVISTDYIKVNPYEKESEGAMIHIEGVSYGIDFLVSLDKSTAIKFAKTLRTEINKIKN
jgi:hypothetical protein